MFRVPLLLLCAVVIGSAAEPWDIAWAAENAAAQHRVAIIPELARLVEDYQTQPDIGAQPTSPETAAIEAVADALIQLQAKLPAATVMHLYPDFPAQTIILLSRSPDNADALLQIFQTTHEPARWLAAGNLLSLQPSPEFVRAVLADISVRFTFEVIPPGAEAFGLGSGGGSGGSSYVVVNDLYENWPKARTYALVTSETVPDIVAPGIHPVGFRSWENTDYRDHGASDDYRPGTNKDWAIGLVAQMQHETLSEMALKPEITHVLPYTSDEDFLAGTKTIIDGQSAAFHDVLEWFVQANLLSIQDSTELHLKCRIDVNDLRQEPLSALPVIEGKWCQPLTSGSPPSAPQY